MATAVSSPINVSLASAGTATSGQVLVADGAGAAVWTNQAGAMTLISSVTTSGSQATVDFTSIPGTYKHLVVRYSARSLKAATVENLYLKVNNDGTGGNYSGIYANFSVAGTYASGATGAGAAGVQVANINGTSITAGISADGDVKINNYAGTAWQKMIATETTYGEAGNYEILKVTGKWASTAAITRLTFSAATGFTDGSRFDLYGIS